MEHEIIVRLLQESTPEGLEDVEEDAVRQDMEETVALEEVRL